MVPVGPTTASQWGLAGCGFRCPDVLARSGSVSRIAGPASVLKKEKSDPDPVLFKVRNRIPFFSKVRPG